MKIALDYREAANPTRAGKGEYVFQLTKALHHIAPDIELILLIERGQKTTINQPNCRILEVPASWAFWHIWVACWLTFIRPVDVYLATTSVIVPAISFGTPVATTLFDFTPWRFPATHNNWANFIETMFMRPCLLRSRWLLAISEFTKSEAVKLFGIPPQRITVTPLGLDGNQFSPSAVDPKEASKLKTKYHLPNKFVLYLGTIEPRKNITAIIESFGRISQRFPNVDLVLAGGRGWYANQILSGITNRVHLAGYVNAKDRANLYRLASVFVFPSLYEGFGIPPLEAMAVGTPTVISNRASLPEVGGDVAATVSLENPKELDDAISNFLSMSPSAHTSYRTRAASWAKHFSWDDTARKTLNTICYDN